MIAVAENEAICMGRLLQAKSHVSEKDIFGRTPLHLAALYGKPEVVRILLDNGASSREKDSCDNIPLHCAGAAERTDTNREDMEMTIKLLLHESNTTIDIPNHSGDTPIMEAISNNQIDALRCLAQAGASFSTINNQSQNILHYAALYCNFEVLVYLKELDLSRRIGVDVPDSEGNTPWDAFIFAQHEKSWKLGSIRKPSPEESLAFVDLYKNIRNQKMANDILLLEKALFDIDRKDEKSACLHLSMLQQHHKNIKDTAVASFYSGIEKEIASGLGNRSRYAIQEDLMELETQLQSDPWDQLSRWDSLDKTSDVSDCETTDELDESNESGCSTVDESDWVTNDGLDEPTSDSESIQSVVRVESWDVEITNQSNAHDLIESSTINTTTEPLNSLNHNAQGAPFSNLPTVFFGPDAAARVSEDLSENETPAQPTLWKNSCSWRYRFYNWYSKFEKMSRPKLEPGFRRIEWECDCGKSLFADFPDQTEKLNDLEYSLQNPGYSETSGGSCVDLNTLPSTIAGPDSNRDVKETEMTYKNVIAGSTQSDAREGVLPQSESTRARFLALCVNTGGIYKSLAEDNMLEITSDAAAFLRMKNSYTKIRGYRSRLTFLVKPRTIEFVQFTLWNLRGGFVSICKRPDSVPPSDVHNYECLPPRMPPEVFIHYLEHGEGVLNPARNDWLPSLPKRLDRRVIDSEIGCSGWGIHVVEGPNRAAIFWVCMLTMAGSVLLTVLWSSLRDDVQGGAGLGTLIVALPPAILTAFLFKVEAL